LLSGWPGNSAFLLFRQMVGCSESAHKPTFD
jgi:hypothetical protein